MKKIKTKYGIASWKIDTPIEKWLAVKADKSVFWRKIYVLFYKTFDADYYKKGLKYIDKNINLFMGNASAKQRKELIIDMVYSLHRFGCMFDEYFLYNFSMLNKKGRETFVTDKIRWEYYEKMNSSDGIEIFNDKKKTYDLFKEYYLRDLVLITNKSDKQIFVDFVKKHKDFIIKPYNSSGGRGVCKKSVTEENIIGELFEELISDGSGFICEEIIIQSQELSSFHPFSVNTVRFTTIKDDSGINLFYPLLRTGVGGSLIDNATGGGIFALIDPESGVVYTKAKDEKGNSFFAHPDTGVIYPGFKLPEWEKAVELVKNLASVMEDMCYVGWDIAHTDKGWVMVEGNPRGQMIMMQLFHKNGFKSELESYINQKKFKKS